MSLSERNAGSHLSSLANSPRQSHCMSNSVPYQDLRLAVSSDSTAQWDLLMTAMRRNILRSPCHPRRTVHFPIQIQTYRTSCRPLFPAVGPEGRWTTPFPFPVLLSRYPIARPSPLPLQT